MFISPSSYPLAYSHIVARARQSRNSIVTFLIVSTDVDALCASRLLVDLLTADDVGHTVLPVSGWEGVRRARVELEKEEVHSLILLNLGAIVDLSSEFNFPLAPGGLIHVIDSHRPINLSNLFLSTPYASVYFDGRSRAGAAERDREGLKALEEEERILRRERVEQPDEKRGSVVLWSEGDDADRQGEREAFEKLQYEPDSDSDDSDEDSEPEEEEDEEDSDDDEDDDGDSEAGSSRRKRKEAKRKGKRRKLDDDSQRPLTSLERKKFRQRIMNYYSKGTYYGRSVTYQVFLLSVLLERANLDAVWYAILGVTHQFTTNLIDREKYDQLVELLSDEVARLSSDVEGHTSVASIETGASSGPNDRSVRPNSELRFCLLRHWNLYDAMYHSAYMAGKLQLWKEKGRKMLQGFLAQMGVSLDQSQQTYAHMDTDLKHSLFDKIDALTPEFELYDLSYPSFVRKAGYRSDMSAGDAVEGLGAILEVASGVKLDFGAGITSTLVVRAGAAGSMFGGGGAGNAEHSGTREEWKPEGVRQWIERGEKNPTRQRDEDKENAPPNGANGDEDDEDPDAKALKEMRKTDDWWKKNFFLAWDALNGDTELLRRSFPLSMALHRTIIRQGTAILNKRAVKTLRRFRLATVDEGPDLDVFCHPATLLRLAVWLVDTLRDINGRQPDDVANKAKQLPLVLASFNKRTDAFLVVGVTPAAEFGDVRKNPLGLLFREAAAASGARTRHDAFEAAVLEVKKDGFKDFLKSL